MIISYDICKIVAEVKKYDLIIRFNPYFKNLYIYLYVDRSNSCL